MNVFAPVGVKAIKSKPAVVVLECVANFVIHTTVVHPKLKICKFNFFSYTSNIISKSHVKVPCNLYSHDVSSILCKFLVADEV